MTSSGPTSVTVTRPTSLTVTIEGQTHTLSAGSGCFWDKPVYNASNSVAYVLRNRGRNSGYDAGSIAKTTKDEVIDPVVQCSTSQGNILKIYNVSEDGQRILVELHFVTRKSATSTDYGTRPVILDIKKGTLSEIEF